MSSFFEQNKRKSAAALLLLFFFRWRTLGVLLFIALLFFFVFSPPDAAYYPVWMARLARTLGLDMSGAHDSITKFLNRTEARKSEELWANRGIDAVYLQKGSSLDMIKGLKFSSYPATYVVKNPKTVAGIVNPKDIKRMAQGVPLDLHELLSGLVRNAYGEGAGAPLDANTAALMRGRAVSPEDGLVPQTLSRLDAGSAYSGNKEARVSKRGKLSSFAWGQANYTINKTKLPNLVPCSMVTPGFTSTCAAFDLAEVQAYSCLAAPPDVVCPGNNNCPVGNCPGEFASYMGGAPFAGAEAGGIGILALNTDPVPLTPNAQASLQNSFGTAKDQHQCASQVRAAEQTGIAQVSRSFMNCCSTVNQSFSKCSSNSCSFTNILCCFGINCPKCAKPANQMAQACSNTANQAYSQLVDSAQNAGAACSDSMDPGVGGFGATGATTSWMVCNNGNPYK